jgi:dATP pyrophosphohydrolase
MSEIFPEPNIKEEIPVKSFMVAVYVCRIEDGIGKYLVMKRASEYLAGTWQMVTGRVEKGEKAWEAALREIKEETGLVPDRFYCANDVEIFYEIEQNCVNLVPVFVGFVGSDQEPKLSAEHSEYKWITIVEVDEYLPFEQQRKMIRSIEENFVRCPGHEFLRIDINNNG